MTVQRIIGFLRDLGLFLQTIFDMKHKATSIIKKEADDEADNFLLLCFPDLIGLPSPTSYYTLELLPYLTEDLDSWTIRILGRKSILEERGSSYDTHA